MNLNRVDYQVGTETSKEITDVVFALSKLFMACKKGGVIDHDLISDHQAESNLLLRAKHRHEEIHGESLPTSSAEERVFSHTDKIHKPHLAAGLQRFISQNLNFQQAEPAEILSFAYALHGFAHALEQQAVVPRGDLTELRMHISGIFDEHAKKLSADSVAKDRFVQSHFGVGDPEHELALPDHADMIFQLTPKPRKKRVRHGSHSSDGHTRYSRAHSSRS
jgi:hypothetical protein